MLRACLLSLGGRELTGGRTTCNSTQANQQSEGLLCASSMCTLRQARPSDPTGKERAVRTQIAMMTVGMIHSKAGTLGLEDGDVSWAGAGRPGECGHMKLQGAWHRDTGWPIHQLRKRGGRRSRARLRGKLCLAVDMHCTWLFLAGTLRSAASQATQVGVRACLQ